MSVAIFSSTLDLDGFDDEAGEVDLPSIVAEFLYTKFGNPSKDKATDKKFIRYAKELIDLLEEYGFDLFLDEELDD